MISVQKEFILCGLGVILALWQILTLPCLVVTAGGQRLLMKEAVAGMALSLRFIHSVQKTPVEEFLVVNEACNELTLTATKYQSFGVGLPFLPGEGEFTQEGDYFYLRGQNRHFKELGLRVGKGTELSLSIADKYLPVYEDYAPGTLVELKLVPLWKGLVIDE
ncbi:DUF1850 domain-containing protein [Selenomonas sp. AE3005]|uniref:DUF1850 domain-containing protein n=1 Tax=Selenomonas sp. AE3005 TaxID=1485543 RepID=UPI0025E6BD94|nr:DUF1850 domain-containing protein [Selenomonas sp. AE3005]